MEPDYTQDEDEHIVSEHEQDDALRQKLDVLKTELALCRKEKEEYLFGWQRCQADAINTRKEEERNRRERMQFATRELLGELIDVIITFDHAFYGMDQENPYARGFRNIYMQLSALLSREGIEQIDALGQPFDTSQHEAMESVPVMKKEKDHMVVEEVEKGYTLHGRVIKPSKVKIGEYKE